MSNELLAQSEGEAVLERDLRAADIEALDRRLLDPTSDAVDRVRPASITYGLEPVDASGAESAEDVDGVIGSLLAALTAAGSRLVTVRFVTTVQTCLALSFMRDSLGNRAFPLVTASGGTVAGLPLIASASAPAGTLTAVDPLELLVADNSQVEVSTSRFATLQPVGRRRHTPGEHVSVREHGHQAHPLGQLADAPTVRELCRKFQPADTELRELLVMTTASDLFQELGVRPGTQHARDEILLALAREVLALRKRVADIEHAGRPAPARVGEYFRRLIGERP